MSQVPDVPWDSINLHHLRRVYPGDDAGLRCRGAALAPPSNPHCIANRVVLPCNIRGGVHVTLYLIVPHAVSYLVLVNTIHWS